MVLVKNSTGRSTEGVSDSGGDLDGTVRVDFRVWVKGLVTILYWS